MPIEKRDVVGGLGNVIMGRGVITEDEFVEFYRNFLTQDKEHFKNYIFNISDWSAVTRVEVSAEAIKRMAGTAKMTSKLNDNGVVAIIGSDDTTFGLARMWEMLMHGSNWEIMVFRNQDDAEEWVRKRVKDKYDLENFALP